MSTLLTIDDAIRRIRSSPQYSNLIRDTYLDADVREAARRFGVSAEFSEIRSLLGDRLRNAIVLDLGAGSGIASVALATTGARLVYALEPDDSELVGNRAIAYMKDDLPIEIIEGIGEQIPLPDRSVDIIYARQVLHHIRDLPAAMMECKRILRPGGLFIACREHVVDDDDQLRIFLEQHPIHQLTGGENAYSLHTYLGAFRAAGLNVELTLGPWDSVINAFPSVRSQEELDDYPALLLSKRLGRFGKVAATIPGVKPIVWRSLKRERPGRLYTFVATRDKVGGEKPWT